MYNPPFTQTWILSYPASASALFNGALPIPEEKLPFWDNLNSQKVLEYVESTLPLGNFIPLILILPSGAT